MLYRKLCVHANLLPLVGTHLSARSAPESDYMQKTRIGDAHTLFCEQLFFWIWTVDRNYLDHTEYFMHMLIIIQLMFNRQKVFVSNI